MRTISKKQSKRIRDYRKNRLAYLRSNDVCERCHQKMATDVHHRKGRTGDLLLEPIYFMAVCRECHQWIEEHPKEAKEIGYSLSRLSV